MSELLRCQSLCTILYLCTVYSKREPGQRPSKLLYTVRTCVQLTICSDSKRESGLRSLSSYGRSEPKHCPLWVGIRNRRPAYGVLAPTVGQNLYCSPLWLVRYNRRIIQQPDDSQCSIINFTPCCTVRKDPNILIIITLRKILPKLLI